MKDTGSKRRPSPSARVIASPANSAQKRPRGPGDEIPRAEGSIEAIRFLCPPRGGNQTDQKILWLPRGGGHPNINGSRKYVVLSVVPPSRLQGQEILRYITWPQRVVSVAKCSYRGLRGSLSPPPATHGGLMDSESIKTLIRRRRLQLIVHSAIYYVLSDNIVSDDEWKEWAMELVRLQKRYPKLASEVEYNSEFQNFDHSTGYNLPIRTPWAIGTAMWLLRIRDQRLDEIKTGTGVMRN